MACSGDGVPPWDEPMMVAPEPSPIKERLRPPKLSVMNSRLLKQMGSPKEKTSLNKHLQSAATMSVNKGTIGMSRGKEHYKSPFLHARYKVTHSYSEVVL
jgi:hypothetical protein